METPAAGTPAGDESFRALVELLPDAVFVIADGYHVFANARGIALLGGRTLADLQTKPALEFMHSSVAPAATGRLASMNGGNALAYVEEKVVRLDGTVVDIESAGSPITYRCRTAALVVVRDITARKAAEAALEAAQQRFTAAFTSAPAGMAILREDGRVVEANPAFGRMLGLDPEDLRERCVWDRLEATPGASGTVRYPRPNGEPGWLHVSTAPLPGTGLLVVHALDVTAQKLAEADLARRATSDPLTGLANRTLFYERISAALPRARRHGRTIAVMFVDLDGFKAVNDTAGHDAGDALLRTVADRLLGCARTGSTVARLGGDEFGVLLEDVRDGAEAQREAQRICVALPLGAAASIGIAVAAPDHQQDAADLLHCADVAMYTAKRLGGSRFAVYAPDLPGERDGSSLGRRRLRDEARVP